MPSSQETDWAYSPAPWAYSTDLWAYSPALWAYSPAPWAHTRRQLILSLYYTRVATHLIK